jgi:WD40 repeat protein
MQIGQNETHNAEYQARKNGVENVNPGTENQGGLFVSEEVSGGDQFMAVKPWEGAVKPPSNYRFAAGDDDAPDAELDLEFVHGYRCHDVRNNIAYSKDGKNVLYFTAAVGVIHNLEKNAQTFVFENTDDILSMATYEDLCCTGEIGPRPVLSLWNNLTGQVYGNLIGVLTKGICQIAFDSTGTRLAAIGMDTDHTVVIFDVESWKAGETHHRPGEEPKCVLARGKGPRDKIMHLKWNTFDDKLVIASNRELYFMNVSKNIKKGSNASLSLHKGTGWNPKEKCGALCVGFLGDDIITGSVKGQIVRWKGNSWNKTVSGKHTGPVYCCWSSKSGSFISGGADG